MHTANKKAIITGAGGSIGRAIALALAPLCSEIIISYHNDTNGAQETLRQLAELGVNATALCVDFSKPQDIAPFVAKALDQLKTVDILVNNASMISREQLFQLTAEKMTTVFQVNTLAPLYITQLCAQNMCDHETKGSIINISSIASIRTFGRGCVYAASKAALNKLTENLSLELAPLGIRVNAIAPGVIEAGMNANTKQTDKARWDALLTKIPLKRYGSPEDISHLVAFLVSDKASWISGKVFQIDGGQCT